MRKRVRLSQVENPAGRVDVALYRIADRLMGRLESEQGLAGLRENLLPIVEDVIQKNVPPENMIPREIQAVLKVCALNQGKRS